MTYDIYIKGVSEPTYRVAAYAVYDEQGNLVYEGCKRSMPSLTVSTTAMSFCMELYAASSAVYKLEEGSAVCFHTNNKTIASWITKMELQEGDYEFYWLQFATIAVHKHLASISAEWHKRDTCPRLDAVRKKAFK